MQLDTSFLPGQFRLIKLVKRPNFAQHNDAQAEKRRHRESPKLQPVLGCKILITGIFRLESFWDL